MKTVLPNADFVIEGYQLHATFRLVSADHDLSGAAIDKDRKILTKRFLRIIPRFGTVVRRTERKHSLTPWTCSRRPLRSLVRKSGRASSKRSRAVLPRAAAPRSEADSRGASWRSCVVPTVESRLTHLRQFEPEIGGRNADFLMFSRVRIDAPAKCSVTKSLHKTRYRGVKTTEDALYLDDTEPTCSSAHKRTAIALTSCSSRTSGSTVDWCNACSIGSGGSTSFKPRASSMPW